MNTTSTADPAELEPDSDQNNTEAAQSPEEKVRFGPELSDFLAATEQMYQEMGKPDKAAEIKMAADQLGEPKMHSAAIAEVYLYATAWQSQLRMAQEVTGDDQSLKEYYDSRQIFMENCTAVFPYPQEISRENIGPAVRAMEDLLVTSCPSLTLLAGRLKPIRIDEKADRLENDPVATLAIIDDISSAVSISIEGALAKESAAGSLTPELQGQLNLCVREMYRLELLRNILEKEVSRAQRNGEEVKPAEAADLGKERSLQELKEKVEGHYKRIGLDRQFGISLDEWMAEELRHDANFDTFGEDDLGKWRRFERGIDGVREWLTNLNPGEKPNRYKELLEKLDKELSGF